MRRPAIGPKGIISVVLVAFLVIGSLAAISIYNQGQSKSSTTTSFSSMSTSTPSSTSESSQSSSSETTTSTNSTLVNSVGNILVEGWIQVINNRQLTCCYILNYYTDNSSLEWSGNVTTTESVFAEGKWSGTSELNTLYYGSLVPLRSNPGLLSISDLALNPTGAQDFNATFVLTINGTSSTYGVVNATARVNQEWALQPDSGWRIMAETWDFSDYHVQYPQPASQVAFSLSQWQRAIDNINSSGEARDFYNSNSQIQVTGNTSDSFFSIWRIGGNWTSIENIEDLYAGSLEWFSSSHSIATISNLSISNSSAGAFTVTFHLFLNGTTVMDPFTVSGASMNVKQVWISQETGWRIQNEYWDVLNYTGGAQSVA